MGRLDFHFERGRPGSVPEMELELERPGAAAALLQWPRSLLSTCLVLTVRVYSYKDQLFNDRKFKPVAADARRVDAVWAGCRAALLILPAEEWRGW